MKPRKQEDIKPGLLFFSQFGAMRVDSPADKGRIDWWMCRSVESPHGLFSFNSVNILAHLTKGPDYGPRCDLMFMAKGQRTEAAIALWDRWKYLKVRAEKEKKSFFCLERFYCVDAVLRQLEDDLPATDKELLAAHEKKRTQLIQRYVLKRMVKEQRAAKGAK